MLPQHLTLQTDRAVDDVLGIAAARRALRAVEAGDVTAAHLEMLDGAWDVEERARATLDRLGLAHVGLDRTVAGLSGGESVLLALAGLLVDPPDVLLLDEPTNNLDGGHRARLHEAVDAYRGVLVVISHDRALLGRVDRVAELRNGGMGVHAGDVDAYERTVAAEQDAARRRLRAAQTDLRRQRRDRIRAQTRIDRHDRVGRQSAARGDMPKIVAGARKRQAQVSAGRLRGVHDARIDAAEDAVTDATAAVREDDDVAIDLPGTVVPSRRRVLSGTGLPQRLEPPDERATLLQTLRAVAPTAPEQRLRAGLAVFGFRGDRAAAQPVGSLSGGERFRAVLAAILHSDPPPQLLLLDEPTNNLDLATVAQLGGALVAYRGALLVASHDLAFLRTLHITRWLLLDGDHGLHEVDAPVDHALAGRLPS